MKTQYNFFNIVFLTMLFAIFFATGCKKLDLAPRDKYSELTYWTTTANVNLALNNVYHWLYSSGAVISNDGLSDNAFGGGDDNIAIAKGNFTPDLGRFSGEWSHCFTGIKACNIFLENVDKNQTLSANVKERMKAEVRFVRAWLQYDLVKWWGDVPLMNKDLTVEESKQIHRTPRAEVVKFITDELEAITNILPKREEYAAEDLGRITKGAAQAFKARVLLYEGNNMAEVAAISEKIMSGTYGNYVLESSYSSLFSDEVVNKKSAESILALQFVPVQRTWGEYFDMAPISAGARTNGLAPLQELVDSYIMLNGKAITDPNSGYDENNPYVNRDPRFAATIVYDGYKWQNPDGSVQTIYIKPGSTPAGENKTNEYNTQGQGTKSGYYWRKYWDPKHTTGLASGLNLHLIRYADILLMYAEAKESLGQFNADIWNKTIKLIRQRAGFTQSGALDYPGNTNIRNIIRNERRSEFVLEGLRIDDIRRWKIAEVVMNGWVHGARYSGDNSTDRGYIRVQERTFNPAKHYLWPIPPSELSLNKNLTPNPSN